MTSPSAAAGRICTVDLACTASAPRTARQLVSLVLRQWGVTDEAAVADAALVISELVTNVLVHCAQEQPVTVRVELHEERVRVEVSDHEAAVPAQRQPDVDAEGGRGLGIVAELAERWGVEPFPVGKRVFAELPLSLMARA